MVNYQCSRRDSIFKASSILIVLHIVGNFSIFSMLECRVMLLFFLTHLDSESCKKVGVANDVVPWRVLNEVHVHVKHHLVQLLVDVLRFPLRCALRVQPDVIDTLIELLLKLQLFLGPIFVGCDLIFDERSQLNIGIPVGKRTFLAFQSQFFSLVAQFLEFLGKFFLLALLQGSPHATDKFFARFYRLWL